MERAHIAWYAQADIAVVLRGLRGHIIAKEREVEAALRFFELPDDAHLEAFQAAKQYRGATEDKE